MSEALDQAKRWSSEAEDLLRDLPDPNCSDADKVGTIANALQLSLAAVIRAIEEHERLRHRR